MPFIEFIAHLRARRAMALKIYVAILAATLLLAAVLPPRFYATAKLAVLPAPEFTVRQDAGSRTLSNNAFALDQVMKAETEILQSEALHASTLKALGPVRLYPALDRGAAALPVRVVRAVVRTLLSPWRVSPQDSPVARMDSALTYFNSDLSVIPTKEANIIEVTFGHRDGALAAQVVNELLAGYAKRREQLYDDPQLGAVRAETDKLGEAVKAGDSALSAFKAAHTIADYAAERDLLVRRQSDASQALADATATEAEQQARVVALDREVNKIPHAVSLFQENDTDTRLQTIDASLVDLRAQVAAARVHYRDSSHKVSDLLNQLSAREAEREHLARNPLPSVGRIGRSPALDALLLDRARATTERAAATARLTILRSELSAIASRLAALNSEEAALASLQRDKAVADVAYANASQVLAERRMTEAEDALRLANVRVIQPARTPLHAAPTPLFVVLAGALLGGAAVCSWCTIGIFIRPTLLTSEGLAQATGLPVLGVFPAGRHGTATGLHS
jgi:uncharacterized protein involved in exopolysaccharide biosynthesis